MTWRRVVEEFEADLYTTGGFFKWQRGEAERKVFDDGEEELEIWARKLDVPDSAQVELAIGDRWTLSVPVEGGRLKVVLSKKAGDNVPEVRSGDTFEVRAGGAEVLLRGTFEPD